MKKLPILAALVLSGFSVGANAGYNNSVILWGTDDVPHGVRCEFKAQAVTVIAKDAADCARIGGEVTHEVKTVSVPVEKPKK